MSLDLATLNERIEACGCCPHPRCCPPQIRYQSRTVEAFSVGFINPSSSDDRTEPGYTDSWKQTRYLTRKQVQEGITEDPTISEYTPGNPANGTYISQTFVADWVKTFIEEYSQAFTAAIAGPPASGTCEESTAEYSFHCTATGGWTEEEFTPYFAGGGWSNFRSYQHVGVIEDIGGDPHPAHAEWVTAAAAWDAAHPDYPGEVADYEAAMLLWQIANDQYEEDYQAWVDGGEIGEPPEPPGPAPAEPEPRPVEPAATYPPCTMKTTHTVTRWERVGGVIQLVPPTTEMPNPHVYETIPGDLSGGATPVEFIYESPVTYEEWIAAIEEWLEASREFEDDEEIEELGDDYCVPGTADSARKNLTRTAGDANQSLYEAQWFRYQIQLNKCCAWPSIHSEWDLVFFPKEWLAWRELVDSLGPEDPVPPEPEIVPVATPQVWLWEGTPPRCEETIPPADPFDHEEMFSPWSLTVFVEDGEVEGIIENRNYQQLCYGTVPDTMPAVFGTYEEPEETEPV